MSYYPKGPSLDHVKKAIGEVGAPPTYTTRPKVFLMYWNQEAKEKSLPNAINFSLLE